VSQVIVFLALAFSVVIAIFAVQNTTPVPVSFLTFRSDAVAVSVLVLVSAVFGAAAMLLLGMAREINLRWRHRAVAQQLKTAQARGGGRRKDPPTTAPALSATTTPIETTAPVKTDQV
jgi:uncharacterized integral membrane protein